MTFQSRPPAAAVAWEVVKINNGQIEDTATRRGGEIYLFFNKANERTILRVSPERVPGPTLGAAAWRYEYFSTFLLPAEIAAPLWMTDVA